MKIVAMFALGICSLMVSGKSFAAFECSNGSLVRKVEVVYAEKDKKVPCAVKYTTEDQTEKEVASAKAQEGVCEEKAKTLSDKLTGFGWKCEEK